MKYQIKQITITERDKVEFPEGAIILEVKPSTTLCKPGGNYRNWFIYYLEPLIGEPPLLSDEEIVIVKDAELEAIGETENYFAKQRAVDRAIAQAQKDICVNYNKEVKNGS